MAVVGVEGGVPGVGGGIYLILADQIVTVGVGVVNRAVDDLFDNLGVAGGVTVVDQVALDLAVDDLADAVAVAIVNEADD